MLYSRYMFIHWQMKGIHTSLQYVTNSKKDQRSTSYLNEWTWGNIEISHFRSVTIYTFKPALFLDDGQVETLNFRWLGVVVMGICVIIIRYFRKPRRNVRLSPRIVQRRLLKKVRTITCVLNTQYNFDNQSFIIKWHGY